MTMKSKIFLLSAVLVFAVTAAAAAETATLSGYKFKMTRTQVKDLGDGVFEITIPPSKGWPMILIYPPQLPAEPGTLQLTVRKIAPDGNIPKRLRLLPEPNGCGKVVQLANSILKDDKPHPVKIELTRDKVKMAFFSIAAHEPEQPIIIRISDIKVVNAE